MFERLKQGAARLWAKVKYYFLATLAAVGLVTMAPAADKDIGVTYSDLRTDGTTYVAATDQKELRVYCDGDVTPTYVFPGAPATVTLTGLSFGSHSCQGTSVDNFDGESDRSPIVTFVVTPARPNPPVLSVS